MSIQRIIQIGLTPLLAIVAVGCASTTEYYAPAPDPYYELVLQGGRGVASTDLERALLEACAEASLSEPIIVGEGGVSATVAYAAASGLVCRQVTLAGSSRGAAPRLVCGDGTEWFFAPDVFGGEGDSSSSP